MRKSFIMLLVLCGGLSTIFAQVQFGGLGQVQLVNDSSLAGKELYFTVKRARIFAKGDISDKVGIFMQMETCTAFTNMLDLTIDYKVPFAGKVAVGRFVIPLGYQNTISPYNLHTINYSQVIQKLAGGGARDFGVRVTGKSGSLDWVLAGINGSDFSAILANATEDNNVKDFAGRIGYSPLKNLSAGISMYSGKATAAVLTRNRSGIDMKYEGGPYYLLAEYMTGENNAINAMGYYAEAGYRILDLQPMLRYDVYDGNTAAEDNSEIAITAVGLNYYLGDSAKLQFIYEGKLDKAGAGFSDADNNTWILQTAVKF